MEKQSTITSTGIWGPEEVKKGGYPHNDSLVSKLAKVFSTSEVIRDFGCGDAYYITKLQEHGYKVFGYDGFIPKANKISDRCMTIDLSKHIPVMFRGQVLSLEVGEHIPAEFEDVFLDNLVSACSSRMVLSWAIPGQGGLGHVNCHNNAHVIKKMAKRGFYLNVFLTDFLRQNTPMEVKYFEKSIMVFDPESIN